MSKYIIKNCPAYCYLGKECHSGEGQYGASCCEVTDCKIKQIVELCKGIKCPCEYKGADCWECTESGARRFANKILELLDIQEIE